MGVNKNHVYIYIYIHTYTVELHLDCMARTLNTPSTDSREASGTGQGSVRLHSRLWPPITRMRIPCNKRRQLKARHTNHPSFKASIFCWKARKPWQGILRKSYSGLKQDLHLGCPASMFTSTVPIYRQFDRMLAVGSAGSIVCKSKVQ